MLWKLRFSVRDPNYGILLGIRQHARGSPKIHQLVYHHTKSWIYRDLLSKSKNVLNILILIAPKFFFVHSLNHCVSHVKLICKSCLLGLIHKGLFILLFFRKSSKIKVYFRFKLYYILWLHILLFICWILAPELMVKNHAGKTC